jgi:voltage-gated potassium channel
MSEHRLRRRTYELFAPRLGGRVGVFVDWAIITLIALNILAVMFETVDPIAVAYARELYLFELVSVAIFSVEYIARLWAAVEAREFRGPISGRLRFASRPLMLVDLVAIAPFYIAAVFAIDLRFMRALRLVRIFRLLKIARYSASLRSFGFVLRKQKEKLAVAAFVDVLVLVLAASAMYQLEHAAQPEQFSSIPATLWWGAVTLTTVGYGDMYPITPEGQFAGAIIAIFGIGLFALPASILAAGFIEELQEQNEPVLCPHCGEPIEDDH